MLTVRDAAKLLGVSPGTIYGLVGSGKLAAYRIGNGRGVIRLDGRQIDEFLNGSVQKPPADVPTVRAPKLRHLRLS